MINELRVTIGPAREFFVIDETCLHRRITYSTKKILPSRGEWRNQRFRSKIQRNIAGVKNRFMVL